MNTTLKVVGGVLLGAAIGAGIGLMVAPAKGEQMKGLLKKKSKKYSKQALEAASAYIDGLKKNYNKKVDTYAENGKYSIDSLKDSIKL
ncbi:MAG TPA: YtxH domain-containing protein [Cyclobacteriaceae bacterium]